MHDETLSYISETMEPASIEHKGGRWYRYNTVHQSRKRRRRSAVTDHGGVEEDEDS